MQRGSEEPLFVSVSEPDSAQQQIELVRSHTGAQATDIEQAMLAQNLCLPFVVLGNGEQALHPLHLVLAMLAGQPHAISLSG